MIARDLPRSMPHALPGRSRNRHTDRRGAASIEAVLITAAMLPLVVAIFFMGVKMCQYFFQIIAALVGWPYL